MLFSVKPIFPERTVSRVCLMFALAVWTLEKMGTRFALLGFKPRRISFFVSFTIPHKLAIMNGLVRAITFDTLHPLNSAHTWCMIPFPTFFTLWYSWVHISTINCGNKASNIEPPINEALYFYAALSIPNVDPDNGYVRFGRHFDDS